MRIGIVACEILKNEIELLSANDPDVVHREYLKMGLHDHPEQLREAIINKIHDLEGKVDIVFLGYAICKSLDNILAEIRIPMVMLREEDCIGAILGPIEYVKERSICPGTWYSSPGWAALGIDALVSDEQMEGLEEMGFDKLFFAKKELDGYSRCLFIDTGIDNIEMYKAQAKDLAEQLGLQFECRKADSYSIKNAWKRVKACSSES